MPRRLCFYYCIYIYILHVTQTCALRHTLKRVLVRVVRTRRRQFPPTAVVTPVNIHIHIYICCACICECISLVRCCRELLKIILGRRNRCACVVTRSTRHDLIMRTPYMGYIHKHHNETTTIRSCDRVRRHIMQ